MSAPALDWTNEPEVKAWLESLRTGIDDLAAVAKDQGRPLHKRRLGPKEARRLYREARGKLADLLADATPASPEEPPPSDPAGSGGSPAL